MTDEPTRQSAAARRIAPTPPRLSKADWQRRDRTTVTLTRSELEQIGQLVRAGHAQLNDGRSISPKFRAALTRLGMSTHGL